VSVVVPSVKRAWFFESSIRTGSLFSGEQALEMIHRFERDDNVALSGDLVAAGA